MGVVDRLRARRPNEPNFFKAHAECGQRTLRAEDPIAGFHVLSHEANVGIRPKTVE